MNLETLKNEIESLVISIKHYEDKVMQLFEENERYAKALRFYADIENYKLSAEAEKADLTEFINMLDMDNGDKARKALER